MVMMVVEDKNVEVILGIIKDRAYTGNFGDGKVFISTVDEAFTVRTGAKGL